ncbi:MAG: hypothetical protein CMI02_11915, partial [Oceanospirillaceae bacterium]|nr:hypothetical protein [Oceanospirillaceae bacterium]
MLVTHSRTGRPDVSASAATARAGRKTPGRVTALLFASLVAALVSGCGDQAWNNPHPSSESGQNIIYSAFSERPKHLDPARSYSSDEARFIDNIYEPPLEYHYLKRPYELVPSTLTQMPVIEYSNREGQPVAEDSPDVAYSTYHFELRPGIRYQPHPAFAKDADGQFIYRFN